MAIFNPLQNGHPLTDRQKICHRWLRRRPLQLCQIWSKSVKLLPRYDDFSIFPRWRPSAILDLVCVCSDHPRRAFGGLYCCAEFGWNRCSSFDNMHVFRFHEFGLKTAIHAPKIGVLGILPHKWGAMSTKPKKAHPYASPRRLSHHARKSVDASDL